MNLNLKLNNLISHLKKKKPIFTIDYPIIIIL